MEKENHWSRFAEDFEQRINYVAGIRNIKEIKKALFAENICGKVLELGCGNGTFSETIAKTARFFIATDFSKQMIGIAKEKLGKYQNVKVEQENCLSLSYSNAVFDAVVMINLLHVISEPVKTLLECKRVLKENGKLIISSFTKYGMNEYDWNNMMSRYLKAYGKPPESSRILTINTTQDMLINVGLKIEKVKLVGEDVKSVFAVSSA